ncbi:transcriptional regulator, AraC family with Parallel beta-helix repeat [marine actinobacterium PHSC20C1]|nr:transcriptional regulator, AraC family with Parallel beta-helix repeat [marine actinobacterium PHSC20C1]
MRDKGVPTTRARPRARFTWMRSVVAVVTFGLLASVLTVLPSAPAEAAVVQWGTNAGTSPNYQTTVNGDFLMAGNGVLACDRSLYPQFNIGTCADLHSASGGNGNTANDNFFMANSNTVSGFTTNSSSATVTIPSGAAVTKAFLSWSGNTGAFTGSSEFACTTPNSSRGTATMPAGSALGYRTQVAKFKVGSGAVANVPPASVLEDPVGTPSAIYYSASADVTSAFSGAATGTPLTVSAGDLWSPQGAGCYAGWTLTVVYDYGIYIPSNVKSQPHRIIFYEGHVRLTAAEAPLTVGFNGFSAITTGTRAGYSLFEGDRIITGDVAEYSRGGGGYSQISNSAGNTNNIGIGRGEGSVRYTNTADLGPFTNQSVDVATVDLPNVQAGDTAVNLRMSTSGDSYLLRNAVLSVPSAGINVSKTFNGTLDQQSRTSSEVATFTITVTNSGVGVLQNISVADDQSNCSRTLTGVTLQPLESYTYTCVANGPTSASYDTTATASASTVVGGNTATGSDSTRVLLSSIALTKTSALAGGATGRAGDTLNYTFTIRNSGDSPLSGVTVTDPLPGLSAITYTWPTSTAGAIAPGATATGAATYTLTQADVDSGSVANTATATGTDADGGVKPTSTSNRTTPIPVNAVLETKKTAAYAGAGVGNVGDTVNYSFSVKNTGNVTLTSVALTDPLAGLSAIAVTWPGASGTLTPGQTATATATYTVKQSDVNAGKVVNQASVSARTPKNVAVSGVSNELTLATAPAAPALTTTKSGTIANPKGVGDVVTYNFSAKNTGNVTLTGVSIADPLAGLSALTYTWPGATGVLTPGQTVTATATYTVLQKDVDAGFVRNTASSSGTSPGGTVVTAASPRIDVLLQTRTPAVSLSKSGALAGGSSAGSTVNYSFVLTNSGNVTLTNAGITDPLSGLSAITYGTWPGGTVGTLAPGQSVTATANYTVKQSDVDAGAVANSATAKATPPTGADVSKSAPATVPITADAKLIVTKSGAISAGTGGVGSTVNYTFSVKNDGNVTLSQVALADPLSGLSPIVITWPGTPGVLAPGQTATATATYTVKQSDVDAGSVKNTATATAKTPSGGTVTQPSTQSVVPTITQTRSIDTTKAAAIAGAGTGAVGDVINYSFRAQNTGNVTLSGVTIADPHTGLSALTYTWPGAVGTLAPGQSVTAVATYTIKQSDVDSGSVKNIATASGTHGGTTVSDPSDEVTVPTVAANPVIATLKSGALAAGATGRAGDTVNFSVKLTNSGNVTLTSVSATDTLPGLSALTYGTWPSGVSGTLKPGESVTATATYLLKQSDVDAGSVSNTATGSGLPPTGAAVSSISPATVSITSGPALTVSKSGAVTAGNGSVNDTITFSFVVRNTGNVTLTAVGIADSLAGLSPVTFGTWPSGTSGTLAPNTQVTATATYTILQKDVNAGSVKNTATASGTPPTGAAISATSTQAVVPTVAASPAIDTTKSAGVSGTGAVGDVITYTLTAKNIGNVSLTGVQITDPLVGLSAVSYGTWPGGVSGTLAPGAEITATATYTIVQSDVDAGSVKNTASSQGSYGGTTVTDPSPPVTTPTVAAVRTIWLAKDGALETGATGKAGDAVNYDFVVRNTGNVTLTGVGVTDPLSGLSAITFGTWPSGTAGKLLPNTQVAATATYILKQSDVDAGSVANSATTRGTPPTGAAVTASDPATVVVASNASLAVAKSGSVTSGAGGVGSTMTFTFSITNPGNVTMTGVAISDSLSGLSAPVYTWPTATAGRIAPGETATATATYTVKQADVDAGSVSNTATVAGKTPTNATVTSPTSTAVVPTSAAAPELTTTKSASVTSGAKVGDVITYSITIANSGNQTLTGITLTDSLAGLSTPVITWPGVSGRLSPGQSATAKANYTVKQADVDFGSITNRATADATAPGAIPVTDDSDNVVTTTVTAAPTLSLAKSGALPSGSTARAGEVITYSFVLRNTGNVTISGAAITDPLPDLSAITFGTWPSGTAGTLAPGTQVTATANYTVKQPDVDAGSIANTANATGTGALGGSASASSSATVPLVASAKLTVSKSGAVTSGNGSVGDTITFSFVVKNTGNVTLSSVGITDTLPDLGTVNFGTWPGGTAGTLAPNTQVTATASYIIKQSDVNARDVRNTATASGTPPSGPAATATSAEAVVQVVPAAPAIRTLKSASVSGTGVVGDVITYTLTSRNTGNVTLSEVTLTDPLPGLSAPTYVWSGGVSGQLNPNETVTGTATYTITQADVDAGSVKNTATSSGTPPTRAVVTDVSSQLVTPTVASAPKIGVTKSGALAPGAQGKAGDTVTWSMTLTNTGNVTLNSVNVTDSLPGISAVTYGTWPSTAGTLAPAQSVTATATYVLTQADIDAGAVSNTATGAGTPPRGSPASATAPATLALASNSSLTLDKAAAIVTPGTGAVGDTVRYTFTAENTGNVTLTGVTITDTHSGLSAISYGTWASGTAGRLAPGQTITATADYVIRQSDQNAGTVTNTASVSGKPPTGPNATASSPAVSISTATRAPGILTTKSSTVSGTGAVGDVITYSITVRNTGNVTLTSVTASDPLPGLGALTYGAWPGGVTGTLQPNTQVVATAKYTIKQADVDATVVSNTASGQGTAPAAGVISDPSDELLTSTVATNAAATFTKSGSLNPGSVGIAGETITYTFTAKNTGNVTLTSVGVTDPLPDLGSITYTWPGTAGRLAPGQTVTAKAEYTVKQSDVDAGSVANEATLAATPPSGTALSLTDPETVSIAAAPRIAVDKTATVGGTGSVGDDITFTMTIRNTGNQTLTVVTLVDSLPGLTTPVFTWPGTPNELAPGESAVAVATYTIDQDDVNFGSVTNEASVTANPPGGAAQVSDSSGDVVVATGASRPELKVVKTTSVVPNPAIVGSTITYSFVVTNTGNVTVENAVLNDPMLGASTPVLPVTTLDPGDSTSVAVDYTITQNDVDAGSVLNTVTASGTTAVAGDPVASPVSSVSTRTVAAAPGISVTKSGTAASKAGDLIDWSFTVTNTGNVTLSGVNLSDALAGVTPVFGAWPSGISGQLNPGDTVSATANGYVVTQSDVDSGSVVNSVTASGTPTRGAVARATTAATVPLVADAGITIVKSEDATPAARGVGDTVGFTFTVTNTGNVTLTGVSITDELDGVSVISYNDWDGNTAGTLGPNDVLTATATYVLSQEDIDRGFVENDSSVAGWTPAGVILNEDSNTATVATEAATLLVTTTKDAVLNGTGVVGDTISYSITLTNGSNVTVTNAAISDTLVGLSPLAFGTWPSGIDGELSPGDTITATANYTVTQADVDAGSVSNTATGAAKSVRDSADVSDDSPAAVTPLVAQSPTIVVNKVGALEPGSTGRNGDKILYSFTLKNTGNVTLTAVNLTDDLPNISGITYTWPAGATAGELAPGQAVTAEATYTLTQPDIDSGAVMNTVTGTATPPGGAANVTDDDTSTVVVEPDASLSAIKSGSLRAPGIGAVGDIIDYSVTATNTGNVTLHNGQLVDPLPGISDPNIVWPDPANPGVLKVNESVTGTAEYLLTQVDIDRGYIENTAKVQALTPNNVVVPALTNTVVIATERPTPVLTVAKTASVAGAGEYGDEITYTFVITNNGNVTTSGITLSDPLPGLSTPVIGWDAANTTQSLAPGESVTATATYLIRQSDVDNGEVVNTATANGTGAQGTPVSGNSPEVVTETVAADSSLVATKAAALAPGATGVAGDTVNYSFTVTNDGNVSLTAVDIIDQLPGLTAVTFGAWASGTAGRLNPGDTVSATATYTLLQSDIDAGSVANSINATGLPPTGSGVTEPASATLPLTAAPNFTVVKTGSLDAQLGVVGDVIDYEFSITNSGNVTLSGVVLLDSLAGVSAPVLTWPGAARVLAPGEIATATAKYTITQDDVDAGSVTNTAEALGVTPAGTEYFEFSDPAVNTTVTRTSSATIDKVGTTPDGAALGDLAHFSFTIKNTGNTTLTGVAITDPLVGISTLVYSWPGAAGELAPAESATATATYEIKQADVDRGYVRNTADVDGTSPIGAVTSSVGPVDVPTNTAAPAINVTKNGALEAGATGFAGDTVNYSFTVRNTGNVTLTNVTLTDPLPELNVLTYTWPTATDGKLAPGQSATAVATYTLTQADVDAGQIDNTVTADGDTPAGGAVQHAADETVTITPVPVLTPFKSGTILNGGIGAVGDTVEYRLTVTNDGNVTLYNGMLLDPLPGLSVPVITWPDNDKPGEIPVGQSVLGVATYEITQADVDRGYIPNTADMSAETPKGVVIVEASNEVIVPMVLPSPNIRVTKAGTPRGSADVADTIDYEFEILNSGNVTLNSVTLSDPLPNLSAITITWPTPASPGILAPGEVATATATYAVTQDDVDAGAVLNIATANGIDPNSTPVTDDSAANTVPTETIRAVVELTKSGVLADLARADEGDIVNWSYELTNTGNVTLTVVEIVDALPLISGMTYVWPGTAGVLEPGQSVTATATSAITQAQINAGSVSSQATGSGTPPRGDNVSDLATAGVVLAAQAGMTVTKAGALNGVGNTGNSGDTIDYSFGITNTGNVTLTLVNLVDALAGVSSPVFTWPGTVGELEPGQTVTATANYTITQNDVDRGSVSNVATASGKPPVGDTISVSTTVTETTVAPAAAALTLAKSSTTGTSAGVGDIITYTFLVENTGNVTVDAIVISDPLPGLSTPVVDWPDTNGVLAPTETATATATYAITQADVNRGRVDNSAIANGTSPNDAPVPSNTASKSTPTDVAAPSILVTKSGALAPGSTGFEGDLVNFSFSLKNTGNQTVTGVDLVDGLSGVSALTYSWPTASAGTLAPGQTVTATATYMLTQDDIDSGSVVNTVRGDATPPSGVEFSESAPATVAIVAAGALDPFLWGDLRDGDIGKVGDWVDYLLEVVNIGNVTLTDGTLVSASGGLTTPVIEWPNPAQPGTILPGEKVTGTASVQLTQADIDRGYVESSASVRATDPNGVYVFATPNRVRTPTVQAQPSMTVVKSGDARSPGVGAIGDTVDFTFVVRNTGNVTIGSIVVTDLLPGMTTPTVNWPTATETLAPTETVSATASYVIRQSDVDRGYVENTANAAAVPVRGDAISAISNTEEVPTEAPNVVVAVTNSGALTNPGPAVEGDTVTWDYNFTNNSNVTLSGVELSDFIGSLPAGDYTWPGTIGVLAPGEAVTAVRVQTLTQADIDSGAVSSIVTGEGTPSIGAAAIASAPATVTLAANGLLDVRKSSELAVAGENGPGDTINYTIVVENTGNVTLRSVTISDSIEHVTINSIVWPAASGVLAPGQTATASATYVLEQDDVDRGYVDNTASARGETPERTAVTANSNVDREVTEASDPSITAEKSGVMTAGDGGVGSEITYSFIVKNTGNVTLRLVGVIDPLIAVVPSDLTFPSATGILGPGERAVGSVIYTVTQQNVDDGTVENTAVAVGTAPNGDEVRGVSNTVNNPTEPAVPSIVTTHTAALADGQTGVLGDSMDYTFQISNSGNVTLDGVTLANTIPGLTSFVYTWPDVAAPGVLAPGESVTVTATRLVTQADVDAGEVRNIATGAGNSPTAIAVDADSAVSVVPLVAASSSLDIDKVAEVRDALNPVVVGSWIDYTFTVLNDGETTLRGVTVSDPKVGTTAVVYGTWPGVVGVLAPNESVTATASYQVRQSEFDAGSASNTARGSGTNPGGGAVSNTSNTVVTPTAAGSADIQITKTQALAAAATGRAGDTVEYRFEVTNTGDVTLNGVTISDDQIDLSVVKITWPGTLRVLAPGQVAIATAKYVLTQDDVDAGAISSGASTSGAPVVGPVVIDSASGSTPIAENPSMTIAKTSSFATFAQQGATINYRIEVVNTGNVTLTSVAITDIKVGLSPLNYTWPGTAGELTPGQKLVATATYVITQDDVDVEQTVNEAIVDANAPSGAIAPESATNTLAIPNLPSIALRLSGVLGAGQKGFPGDVVTFTYIATNTGTLPLTNVTIADPRSGLSVMSYGTWPGTVGQLEPGESITATATYVIRESDAGTVLLETATVTSTELNSGDPVFATAQTSLQLPTKALSYTGSDPRGTLATGLGTLLAGLALILLARRKQRQETS